MLSDLTLSNQPYNEYNEYEYHQSGGFYEFSKCSIFGQKLSKFSRKWPKMTWMDQIFMVVYGLGAIKQPNYQFMPIEVHFGLNFGYFWAKIRFFGPFIVYFWKITTFDLNAVKNERKIYESMFSRPLSTKNRVIYVILGSFLSEIRPKFSQKWPEMYWWLNIFLVILIFLG